MHICNKIVRKFTFRCDFIANVLHYATVLSRWAREFANEVGALEGTTVSLNAILLQMGCIMRPYFRGGRVSLRTRSVPSKVQPCRLMRGRCPHIRSSSEWVIPCRSLAASLPLRIPLGYHSHTTRLPFGYHSQHHGRGAPYLFVHCPLSTINCQLSTINCPLSTVNCQLSIVNCQLSTINCPLSTVHCQLSIVNCQLSTVHCQLSTINCPLSTINCQLSTVNCQLSIVNCQLSTAPPLSSCARGVVRAHMLLD